jgi:hypothetical protein
VAQLSLALEVAPLADAPALAEVLQDVLAPEPAALQDVIAPESPL